MPARLQYFRGILGAALLAMIAVFMPAWLAGCSDDGANAVVELCGNLSVPQDIDSVRVVLYDQNQRVLREGVRQLWTCPGPTLHGLPQTLEFAPAEGDIFVTVQGLKDGVPVLQNTLRTTFSASENRATVSLDRGCIGVQCAAGETCVAGSCELVALAADAVSTCDETPQAPATDAGHPADAGADTDEPAIKPGAYLCPQPDVATDTDAAGDEGINDDEAP